MKTLILGLLLLLPMQASAYIITVDFVDYDIIEMTGTYADLESTLALQVWYGDNSLAYSLADQLEGGLEYPNFVADPPFSPLFAVDTDNPSTWTAWASVMGESSPGSIGGALSPTVYSFAVAQPVPEPSTAALLVLGLAGLAVRGRSATQ